MKPIDIESDMIALRRLIDQIDSTPFRELSKLFDKMATLGDRVLDGIQEKKTAA